MYRDGINIADVDDLIAFKAELLKLSDELKGIYQFLKSDLNELSHTWQDRKFIEFEQNLAPKNEEIRRIAESYETWACTMLSETIAKLDDIGGANLG